MWHVAWQLGRSGRHGRKEECPNMDKHLLRIRNISPISTVNAQSTLACRHKRQQQHSVVIHSLSSCFLFWFLILCIRQLGIYPCFDLPNAATAAMDKHPFFKGCNDVIKRQGRDLGSVRYTHIHTDIYCCFYYVLEQNLWFFEWIHCILVNIVILV